MSIIGSELLLGSAADTGYQISRSLRFNSADSTSLSRTFSTPTSQGTYTFSFWCKRTSASGAQHIFGVDSSNCWRFNSEFLSMTVSGTQQLLTDAVFRDFSAWYHIVFTQSGTLHTIYVNNVSVASGTFTNTSINSAAVHRIGGNSAQFFNGYLADIHFIDGQALTPSSFAETNTTTGQWVPKAYNGSYGNNGFQLKFADNSSNTATTLGKDTSGNGNNWTPNNLSVTAGVGNDSLVDSPTSYGGDSGAGGEVRGNYCTWSQLSPLDSIYTNGNLDVTVGGLGRANSSLSASSGKWYWEATMISQSSVPSYGLVGIGNVSEILELGNSGSQSWGYRDDGIKRYNGTQTSYGASYTVGDVIGIAWDADNGTLTFYKNGTSQGQAFTGVTGNFGPIAGRNGSAVPAYACNFGQRPFAYTAPSGFKALCDTNLPTPTIAKGNTVMDVTRYTGTGAARTISGLGFSPDLVWIKSRSGLYDHQLQDTVRGATKELRPNKLDLEGVEPNGITAFTSDGFSLGGNSNYNLNNGTYVAWCWDAGSSTVTNTAGSITSSVRANASAGFSIVTYTGTGSASATIGHGLGVAPSFVIVKGRNATSHWFCYHASLGASSQILLNLTNGESTGITTWNSTSPTSAVFSIAGSILNVTNNTFVAYCFAPVAGYSAFGTYTGNGSTDGPFVYTGHRAAFILFKRTDGTLTDWYIFDKSRLGYNAANYVLSPNNADPEFTATVIDILSNGFKFRGTAAALNASGGTYIYAAFAENPFQYARAR